jgi:hypothetical protein
MPLALVGGVLTILSPCILAVLPFVFPRADQPFRRSGLPLLGGDAGDYICGTAEGWKKREREAGVPPVEE